MARKPVVIAICLLLASGNVSAQPEGWRRTTEEDKAFDADAKACAAQSSKQLMLPSGGVGGVRAAGSPRVDQAAFAACMKQRGWSKR